MERVTSFALDNSRAFILFLVGILALGVFSFVTIPSQEDPEITIRNAQVSAFFPGMSADNVENLIAKPLEKIVKEIPEVESITSTIRSGQVIIDLKLYDRYFQLASIWQRLRTKIDDISKDLPEGTIGPIVNDDYGRVSSITLAMTGEGFTYPDMEKLADFAQDRLGALDTVSRVEIHGIQRERVYLDVNASRLSNYGFEFADLISALTQQNVILPGGGIDAGGRTIVIEPTGNFASLEDIKNIQVQSVRNGQFVYLQDIVAVRRDVVSPPEQAVYFNSKPAVILAISMMPRVNVRDFETEVRARIDELLRVFPLGIEIGYATYQPELVKKSVRSAVSNLVQTVAVVLVVVVVFLGLRTGLIVGAIVPLTIFSALIVMNISGIDLQRMSIAAIIISLGLLVDNGIVVAEEIKRRMDSGGDAKLSALSAVRLLGLPLLTSSLTTILAFTPLILADNATSEYVRSLAQVVTITLLASWFLAVTATPALCIWFLKTENANGSIGANAPSPDISVWHSGYKQILEFLLRFRIGFCLLMMAGLVIAVVALGSIPKQMMPYSDRNQFMVYVDLPAGTSIDVTTDVTKRLTAWLADDTINPEVENHVAYVGYGGPRFFLMISPPKPADNVAFVIVNTDRTEDVWTMIEKVDRYGMQQMPEARLRPKALFLGAAEIGLVEYRVVGSDIEQIYRIARQLENHILGIPGTRDAVNDWNEPVLRTRVDIDQVRALRAGVSSESVSRALNAYLSGTKISDFREGDATIPITLRGDEARNNWGGLRNLPILSDDGRPIPLLQLADFQTYPAPDILKRYNQERTIRVSAKHVTRQAADLHEDILPFIENLELPPGMRIEVGGEVEASENANTALFKNLPFAIAGILVLLVLQFNSLRRMGIIMLTIPLVIIGAVLGLGVGQAFLSFTAILGIYSLIGIIVNNGIVLLEKIDQEIAAGLHIHDAIVNACLARMRPILMTTLTTILGLIPLAINGGALWYPMAMTIIGGLAVGSVLTLGFVPVLASLFLGENQQAGNPVTQN